jgi:hypothetical protein
MGATTGEAKAGHGKRLSEPAVLALVANGQSLLGSPMAPPSMTLCMGLHACSPPPALDSRT